MARHDFKEYGFEHGVLVKVNGKLITSCAHTLKCIKCDLVIGNSDNPSERIACDDFKTEINDCPEKKIVRAKIEKPKEPWKSPMKTRTIASETDIKEKDYPAKRKGCEAKRRKTCKS